MKTKYAFLLSIATLITGFSINNIASSQYSQAVKIAVVNVPVVVSQSKQVQALKKEQAQKTAELQKWLKTVKADVDKQSTKDAKEKLIKKYDSEFAKKKKDIAQNYATKLKAVDESINNSITNVAKNQGYDIVLSKSSVLYGGDDITDALVKIVK